MRVHERHEMILNILSDANYLTVDSLCQQLNVSPATVRRDLKELEQRRFVQRTHGAVQLIDQQASAVQSQRSLSENMEVRVTEKEKIAMNAATFVKEGDVIALSGGSTSLFIARQLRHMQHITVVTNCIDVARELSPNNEVILLGGKLRYGSMLLVGPIAEEVLKNIRVRKIFMGVEAIDADYGITVHNFSEAHIDRLMARSADEIIVVADISKFSRILFTEVIPFEEIDHIITDSALPEELSERIVAKGVSLTLV